MNIQFIFSNITEKQKEDIREYSARRFGRLEKFLTTFSEDSKNLKVKAEYYERHNAFKITCALQLGGKTIHHDEIKHDARETIDLVESNLVHQTKKYLEQLQEKNSANKKNEKITIEEIPDLNYDNI